MSSGLWLARSARRAVHSIAATRWSQSVTTSTPLLITGVSSLHQVGNYISPFETLPWSKVDIIGYAPSCMLVDWDDPDMCRVGLNDLYRVPGMGGDGADGKGLNYQAWFQMHSEADLNQRDAGHIGWLSKPHDFPIFMQQDWAKGYPKPGTDVNFPSCIEFPLQTVFDTFPDGNYQTNSISYMICWALLESKKFRPDGFTDIYLHGIDMATGGEENGEFEAQRPSVEYFIGLARGYGINVHIPTEADILKAGRLYGYEGSFTIQTKMRARLKMLQDKKRQAEQQAEHLKAVVYGAEGAIQDCEFWLKNWTWDLSPRHEWTDEALNWQAEQGELIGEDGIS